VGKVLVKKAINAQYPVGAGAPVMVLGGGGGSRRGKTMRQRAGGALGGLVGVAGALTGQHRSLGGLTQSMISGGAQGRQLGEGLGRFASGRGSRAKANLRQTVADKHADAKASGEFDRYGVNAGRNAFTRFGHDRMSQSVYDLEQAKQAEKNAMEEARAKAMADAKAFGADEGGRRRQMADDLENFVKVTGMDPARASEFMSQFGERVSTMQEEQQTPPAPLQLGMPPMSPSQEAVDSSAGAQIVDVENLADKQAQTDGMDHTDRLSPAEMPSPQGNNPSELPPPPQNVGIFDADAARRKAKDREEMME